MDADTLTAAILREAGRWVGLREIRPNAAWTPTGVGARFSAALQTVGWQPGWAYCASFTRLVVRDAARSVGADETLIREFLRRQGHGVVVSWTAWRKIGLTTRTPAPGAIFFLRKGRTGLGHAGIVTAARGELFDAIEANTSPQPTTAANERDGQGIYRRTRRLDFTERNNTLWLLGFVHPSAILSPTPPTSASDLSAA